jgi:purine-binding chemotaxis protein CheW
MANISRCVSVRQFLFNPTWINIAQIVKTKVNTNWHDNDYVQQCILVILIVVMSRRLKMTSFDEQKKESTELLQLVSFFIGNEEFGVDILYVQEINRMSQVTKVPNALDFVNGVINLRGRVIPVIDLRMKFGMSPKEPDKNTRIIVMEVSGKTVGFIVDSVNEVLRIPKNVTEAPPELAMGVNSEYIKSVGKLEDRLLILIDLEKILSTEESVQLKRVVETEHI